MMRFQVPDSLANTVEVQKVLAQFGIDAQQVDRKASPVTVIVDLSGNGDATTIQGGISLLPASGGTVAVREGTYNITAPIDIPEKPIKIVGAGCGEAPGYGGWWPSTGFGQSTIISLGNHAIAAFRIPATGTKGCLAYIEDIEILGDGTAGQRVLENDSASAWPNMMLVYWKRCFSYNIEKFLTLSGTAQDIALTLEDSVHVFAAAGSPLTVDNANAGAYPTLTILRCQIAYDTAFGIRGGFTNGIHCSIWALQSTLGIGVSSSLAKIEATNVDIQMADGGITLTLGTSYSKFIDSRIFSGTENDFLTFAANAEKCYFIGTELRMGTVQLVATNRRHHFVGCRFKKVTLAGYKNIFIGNEFLQAVDYAIDIQTGAYENVIEGNYFSGQTSASIRNDGTKHVIANNDFASTLVAMVTETTNANSNRYSNNMGWDGAKVTIVGTDSIVDDVKRKAVSGGSSTNNYVEIFTHKNLRGIGRSLGTIKSTHVGNDIKIRETWIDAFGQTANVETVVGHGTKRVLDPIVNIPAGCDHPITSYKVEVKSNVGGSAGTYDLQHATVGVE